MSVRVRRAAARVLAVAAALAASGLAVASPLRAEDDVDRAFAAARARGALVLVDVWAPW